VARGRKKRRSYTWPRSSKKGRGETKGEERTDRRPRRKKKKKEKTSSFSSTSKKEKKREAPKEKGRENAEVPYRKHLQGKKRPAASMDKKKANGEGKGGMTESTAVMKGEKRKKAHRKRKKRISDKITEKKGLLSSERGHGRTEFSSEKRNR